METRSNFWEKNTLVSNLLLIPIVMFVTDIHSLNQKRQLPGQNIAGFVKMDKNQSTIKKKPRPPREENEIKSIEEKLDYMEAILDSIDDQLDNMEKKVDEPPSKEKEVPKENNKSKENP